MNDRRHTRNLLRRSVLASFATVAVFGFTACKSKNKNSIAPIVSVAESTPSGDPADQNVAIPYTGGNAGGYNYAATAPASNSKVLGRSKAYSGQQSGESYGNPGYAPQQPLNGGAPSQGYYDPNAGGQAQNSPYPQGYYEPNAGGQPQNDSGAQGYYDPNAQGYDDSEAAGEQAVEEANQAPPPLPEYDQPPAPEQNDLWAPGYWNYQNTGYYWVPGAWCAPPFIGALWTPPWWGNHGDRYRFHHGYWGHHIGYYGGINYGFGYIGTGYYGGYWLNRDFVYNRAVTNVNMNAIHDVYDRQVVYNGHRYGPHPEDRVSYNGGRGGIAAQPRPSEIAEAREPHYAPLAQQRDLRVAAASNHSQFFAANGDRPGQAFSDRPVGNLTSIASTPREQPFNHPGSMQPSIRPGGPQPGQPGASVVLRPGFNNENQPGFHGGRSGIQPGIPAQAYTNRPQPGVVQPNGAVERPGLNGVRSGEAAQFPNRQQRQENVQQPGTVVVPPATQGRVIVPDQGIPQQRPTMNGQQPGVEQNRFGTGEQGQVFNHHQSPRSYGQQPGTEMSRPGPQAQVIRPTPQVQQQAPQVIRSTPQVQQPQEQQQARPQFQQARPAPQVEQQQSRPQFQPRAEPAQQARPQVVAPQAAPHREQRPQLLPLLHPGLRRRPHLPLHLTRWAKVANTVVLRTNAQQTSVKMPVGRGTQKRLKPFGPTAVLVFLTGKEPSSDKTKGVA